MTPAWEILEGDCREVLATLADRSVHAVVTSPPYFGLRDYGTAEWEGGDPACTHAEIVDGRRTFYANSIPGPAGAVGKNASMRNHTKEIGGRCAACGAARVDRQIGLEPTPDQFVNTLVAVFREVRRVLRDDGTVWLNLGDSYAGSWGAQSKHARKGEISRHQVTNHPQNVSHTGTIRQQGLKPKDLIGIPWKVAFALRDDGWYLRADIVWAKPNPMPESITDRTTRSHEFIFLLAKSPRYFYDADAIRERDVAGHSSGNGFERTARLSGGLAHGTPTAWLPGRGRNKRDVWTVTTQPYADAHFATFPPALIEPCVLAGVPKKVCAACGAPWLSAQGARELDLSRPQARRARELADAAELTDAHIDAIRAVGVSDVGKAQVTQTGFGRNDPSVQALADEAKAVLGGYYREFLLARPARGELQQACDCDAGTTPGVVLDPFNGAGTTGLVAVRHGRRYVGIELNPQYAAMARRRIETDVRLGHRSPRRAPAPYDGQSTLDLFDGEAA